MGDSSPAEASARAFAAVVHGRVQGVGFRYSTWTLAARFPVQGYVKNLPDGRVELVAEGERSTLETFLSEICSEMDSFIRDVETEWEPGSNSFDRFTIQH